MTGLAFGMGPSYCGRGLQGLLLVGIMPELQGTGNGNCRGTAAEQLSVPDASFSVTRETRSAARSSFGRDGSR